MAADGSAALGAPEITGTLVNPRGYAKKAVARVAGREIAGLVGSTAAALAARNREVSHLPDFGRVGYVAVSATEVAVVKTKYGWKMTPTDEALARAPRSALASVEWDEGRLVSHLTLSFSDGQSWAFDVPKSDKKTARAVVAELQSSTLEGGIDGHDASQILGSPQLAGVIVSAVGAGLQTGAALGPTDREDSR